MKLFRGSSSKTKHVVVPVKPVEDPSIGSSLSSSDQFDIMVSRPGSADRTSPRKTKSKSNRNNGGSILSYFSNEEDGDDSTVSSITVDNYKRSFSIFNKSKRDVTVENAHTSWCCCSTDTTLPSSSDVHHSTDNTLLATHRSIRSMEAYSQTGSQYTGGRHMYHGKSCLGPTCGPEWGGTPVKVSKSNRRPRLFRRGGGRSTANNNKDQASLMSTSLFDTLSNDWDDEEGTSKRKGVVRRRSSQLRRTLTWKRNKGQ